MQRFDPRYWCVNFNTTAAASVIATTSNALLVTCNFRTDTDLIGLFWYSDDTYSHTNFRYSSNYDYSTTTLDFDFVLTNIRALDAVDGPTLTVTHEDNTTDFVRLSNYITSGTTSAGHITLDFTSVGSGWDGSGSIDWTNIKSLMLSLVNDTYNSGGSGDPLSPQQVGTIAISNISVTGPSLTQSFTAIPAHTLRITDGYDDSYPQTPTRIVEQMYQLGYRSWYSIYMGISHHHDLIWDSGESRFVVNNAGSIINDATSAWFDSLLTELSVNGFTNVVISVSYEIVNYLMPTGWQQFDADNNPGLSGWSPPSEFITPSNPTPLDYLADVVSTIFDLFPGGVTKYVQVGEPWWWDNSFTTHEPCFYDSFTVAAYPIETGNPVPTPYLTSTTESTVGYEDFLAWLAQKLGDSTHAIVTRVRLSHPSAVSAILFYTPQIFSTPMLQTVNLPIASWSSPQWDILQVEDYDWVIAADWIDHATTWTTALTTLGYPLSDIQYFSGFNLQADTADSIWPNVYYAINDGFNEGVSQVWVWARPEVFRDGIIWPPAPLTPIDLTCGLSTTSSVTAVWSVDFYGGIPTSYTLQYRKLGDVSWSVITGITATHVVVPFLLANTTYEWEVDASNITGDSGFTTTATCATLALVQVTPRSVEAAGVAGILSVPHVNASPTAHGVAGIGHAGVVSEVILLPTLAMQSFTVTENVVKVTPRLNNGRHDQWLLMRPGDETSLPPMLLWQQMRDSLGSFDDYGRMLPDPRLSQWRNTGTYPGQNMFVVASDRSGLMAARTSFIGIINNILARNPIALQRQNYLSMVYRSAPINENLIWMQADSSYPYEPPPITEWDVQVYTLAERNRLVMRQDFQDALNNGSTIRVLLNGIGEPNKRWSIWNFSAPGVGWDTNGWDLLTLGWDAPPQSINLIEYIDQLFTLRTSYEIAVDTRADRDALVTPVLNITQGDRVLVRHDELDFWAIWRWDGTPSTGNPVDGFVLLRMQYYRTDDYISLVDWYATGYSADSPPVVSYATELLRNTTEGGDPTNLFVKVNNNGSGAWIWTQWDSIAQQWTTVAIQNGTVALSSELCDVAKQFSFGPTGELFGWDDAAWDSQGRISAWDAPEATPTPVLVDAIANRDASWEVRVLADALRYSGLLLDSEVNEIFFSMLNFVHTSEDQVTWAFKTSFMSLLGYDVPLQQTPYMVQDTTPSLISYINEVKPYRVKLREFSTQYNPDIDVANVHATDFDKPLYFDPILGQYRVLDPNDSADLTILQTTKPWSDWYAARSGPLVRSFDMTLLFDRITDQIGFGWGDGPWDQMWDDRDTAQNYNYLHTTVIHTLTANNPTIQVDDVRWLRYQWVNDIETPVSATNPLRVLINGNSYLVKTVTTDDTNVSSTRGGLSGTLTSFSSFSTGDGVSGTVVEVIMPQPSAARRVFDYYVPTDGMPPKDISLLLDLDLHGTQTTLTTTMAVTSGDVLTFASTDNIELGLPVFGPRIVKGTVVTDVSSTTVSLSIPIVGAMPGGTVITFGLPTLIDGYILPAFTSSTAFDVTGFDSSGFDVTSGAFAVTYDGGDALLDPTDVTTDINPALQDRPYGLALRDPYFAANHPQERVPFTSDDGLRVTVTAAPLLGGPSQRIRVFDVTDVGDATATLFFDLIPHSSEAVLVYRDGVRGTLGTEYTVDCFARTATVDIIGVSLVQIHVFGFGGSSTINADHTTMQDNRYFFAFDSNPLTLQQTTDAAHARVVVNGTALTGGQYSVSGTQVTLTSPPSVGDDVAIVLYDGGISTATEIQVQDLGNDPSSFTQVDSITKPEHGGTIVEVNGVRLRPPTTFYGAFTPDNPWMFLPTYPDNTDTITVYVDDTLYTTAIPFCTTSDPSSNYPFKLVVPIGQTPPTNIAGQFVFFDGLMVALDPAFTSDNVSVMIVPPSPLPDYEIDSGVLTINASLNISDTITAFSFTNADSMGWQTVTYDIGNPPYIIPIPFSPNYALVAMDGTALVPGYDYEIDEFDVGWDTLPLDSVPLDITYAAAELIIKNPTGHQWVVASVCTAQAAREQMQWMTYTTTPAVNRMRPIFDEHGDPVTGTPTHGTVMQPLPMYDSRFGYLRFSPYLAGTLVNDLQPTDTEIVVDLLLRPVSPKLEPELPLPTVHDGKPGVVWINGERIEYFGYSQTDQTATLAGLRRGTHGTSIQEQRLVVTATGTGSQNTYAVHAVGSVSVMVAGFPIAEADYSINISGNTTNVTLTAGSGDAIVIAVTSGYTYAAGTVVSNGQAVIPVAVPLGVACGNRDLSPMQQIISG